MISHKAIHIRKWAAAARRLFPVLLSASYLLIYSRLMSADHAARRCLDDLCPLLTFACEHFKRFSSRSRSETRRKVWAFSAAPMQTLFFDFMEKCGGDLVFCFYRPEIHGIDSGKHIRKFLWRLKSLT